MKPSSTRFVPGALWVLGGAGAIFVACLLYLLSYAPYVACAPGYRSYSSVYDIHSSHGVCYQPVEWSIDHTPLREPLLAWARLWRVQDQLELESFVRQQVFTYQ